jgi:hypothetical protein
MTGSRALRAVLSAAILAAFSASTTSSAPVPLSPPPPRAILEAPAPPTAGGSPLEPVGATPSRAATRYATLPLRFEANAGQSDPQVKFLSRGSGHTLFLTPTEAVLRVPAGPAAAAPSPRLRASRDRLTATEGATTAIRMRLLDAHPDPRLVGEGELPGRANYFIGDNPTAWRRGVPSYARVRYERVYPGIDLVFHGDARSLEYDLVVAPGADPSVIRVAFEGVDGLRLDGRDLVLTSAGADVRLRRPVVYQDTAAAGGRSPAST